MILIIIIIIIIVIIVIIIIIIIIITIVVVVTEIQLYPLHTYIHKLYLSSDFSVAYKASISDPN